MEGSVFLSAIICYILLILMPLKINSIYLSSGFVQFYNAFTTNYTHQQSYFTYQIYPIIAPYTNQINVKNQNIITSLSSFSYDNTSNISCIQGPVTTTSFSLNCSGSATSVSYLIFNHAANVFILKNSFIFNSSDLDSGFYDFNLQNSFQKNLPFQKYKSKSQMNAYAFLSNIQIYKQNNNNPISFVSVVTVNPAKTGNISQAKMYPYFRLSFSSDIKCVAISYMIVLENMMPFFWSFIDIKINSIQTTNIQQFGRFFGINSINFINNNSLSSESNLKNNLNIFQINSIYTTNQTGIYTTNTTNETNSSSFIRFCVLNSSVNLSYWITQSLYVTVLNVKSISIKYCDLFSIIKEMCVQSCDNSSQIMINQSFNGLVYKYCVPILFNSSTNNNSNISNVNYTNTTNQSSIITIIGCKQIGYNVNNNNSSINSSTQYYCKRCDNGYILALLQGQLYPSCYCEPGFYMNSVGVCLPCLINQVKCGFLSTLKANFNHQVDQQQNIEIVIQLSKIYSYLQNISQFFIPIVKINSHAFVPQKGSLNWQDNYTLHFNVDTYPMSAQYQIKVHFKSNVNELINQYVLVNYQQTQQTFFSKAQTPYFSLKRAIISQAIVQNIQPYINSVNSSTSTFILIAPLLGSKLSIFSLLQTNSMIYCLNFLKISNKSQYQYSNLLGAINNIFVFQTQPILKLFGDNDLIDIPNLTSTEDKILSQFQSQNMNTLKKGQTFFQQNINQIVFLFIQVVFIELIIFLFSFKLCFLIKKIAKQSSKSQRYQGKKQEKTTYNTQLKQQDSMKVICLQQSTQNNFENQQIQVKQQKQNDLLQEQNDKNFILKYSFSYYIQLQNWTIKWLQKAHLDQQLASLKHTMVLYSHQLNRKKYVFYSSFIISQLISQFIFAYYQLITPIDSLSMGFQLFYASFMVFLLIIYPIFMVSQDSLLLLKIVQIIYKLNGRKDLKKNQQPAKITSFSDKENIQQNKNCLKLYKHSEIYSYFLVIYFQNIFFALSILLGKNILYQTFPIALMFLLKLVFMWNRIKIIDLIKTILLLSLFTILSLTSLVQIHIYNQQIQQLMIYIVMSIAFLQYLKLFKIILISLIFFLKKKLESIVLKRTDKILHEQPRIKKAIKKLQKIKELRTLKQNLNEQLHTLRKANQKRKNEHLSKQLQIITAGQQSKLKKPQLFDGIEEVLQYNPHNPAPINNNSVLFNNTPVIINNDNTNKFQEQQNIKKTQINDMVQSFFIKK